MNDRVSSSMIAFRRPFSIEGVPGTFPPGEYAVEITEAQLDGVSFVAYRRTATTIRLPGLGAAHASWQLHDIDPADLAALQLRDARD